MRSGRGPSGDAASSPSEAGQVTRWWSRLSGRGRWLALAGLIGALSSAAAGWWGVGHVTYRATGVVQLGIAHTSLEGTGDAISLRMDQVVERELSDLRRLAGDFSAQRHSPGSAIEAGTDHLVIQVQRAADAQTRLDLTATSRDPDAVTTDLRTVLATYQSQTALNKDATQAEAWNSAMAQLSAMRAEVAAGRAQLAQTRAAIRDDRGNEASAYVGPITEVDPAWSAALWTQSEARRATAAVDDRLSELETLPTPEAEQVAALDPEAAGWWGRMRGLDAQLADAVWPPNPAMAQRLRERITLEAQLQARVQDTRVVPLGEAGLAFRAVRISETQNQLEQLTQAKSLAEQRVAELEPRLTAWRDLNAQVQQAEAQRAKQEAAAAELDPGSGVRLIRAELISPNARLYRDDRPAAAAWSAAAGCLAGTLLCSVVFVLDKRVRRSRDGGLIGSAVPVLGAVPTTRDQAVRPGEQPMEVASIQAVRAVLESKLRPDREANGSADAEPPGGAFAVTGIAAGSGATSVAVGLAASLALSGSRVLLIDLAWLQKPAGQGTDEDAARSGLGVDGVIEELGYLDDEDREAMALADEGDDSDVGFGAILRGVSLRRSVVETRVAGLSVLSAMGRAEALRAEWAGRVSSRWLSKLMDVARRGGYTATILDAGSATGSVEGMLGCAAADGTVVVVSGGQTQADYDKAVTRLRLVGATILGTVLNRSDAKRLGGKPSARATTAGGTTGSGIFAAAIEAQSGSGLVHGGSGLITAPLPRVEDDAFSIAKPSVGLDPANNSSAFAPANSAADPMSIAAGVDPFSEPPAEVQPTPSRQPPGRSASVDRLSSTSPADGEPPAAPATPASTVSGETPPPSSESPEDAAPEIHVADDVMDQLVDHAIRAAQRPRPPKDIAP